VSIQTMCTTQTKDIKATITQIHELQKIGCDIIRLVVKDDADILALPKIKQSVSIPIVADVFNDVKNIIKTINTGVDKIRINPALLSDESLENIVSELSKNKTPVRISINSGNLSTEIKNKKKERSVESFVEMAFREITRVEKLGFEDIIVSLKSTSILETISANEEFAEMSFYPLHIGMTQAGTENSGVVLNSAAMGYLLMNGIGSTMRMALGGNPKREVLSSLYLLRGLGLKNGPIIIAGHSSRSNLDVKTLSLKIEEYVIGNKENIKIVIIGSELEKNEVYNADIGVIGKNDKVLIFMKGQKIKEIPQSDAFDVVCEIIDQISKK